MALEYSHDVGTGLCLAIAMYLTGRFPPSPPNTYRLFKLVWKSSDSCFLDFIRDCMNEKESIILRLCTQSSNYDVFSLLTLMSLHMPSWLIIGTLTWNYTSKPTTT